MLNQKQERSLLKSFNPQLLDPRSLQTTEGFDYLVSCECLTPISLNESCAGTADRKWSPWAYEHLSSEVTNLFGFATWTIKWLSLSLLILLIKNNT